MGNKVSAVNGVKSDHFYDQGNAVNEIWVGDVEVISRLPFGDSDLEQAGWPPGGFPKIPWHHFIIPMHKRDEASDMTSNPSSGDTNAAHYTCQDWLPKDGYLGMYTGASPDFAYFAGTVFLGISVFLHIYFLYSLVTAFVRWQDLRETSRLLPDPASGRRMANKYLWIRLGKAFVVFVVSVFCLVVGLPAAAAGTRRIDATSFILANGLCVGAAFLLVGLVAPFTLLWCTRKRSAAIINAS
ncbi:uncharacterized protein N7479_004104 [Penicillium vulpinum]|uniref:Uncharacterized protein n=1 Tax=Penicillium vulpinum TaxID=29845 RepID=A0A1V6SCR1_9EURO|nr:uncharacterized protein N7479_004104 [Penicillium vulpinum]KAJ5964228.1 hypothetical protein N7479_004104 [Penicillium vulpinum]OQE11383.1 hypothetical protein PENVUL_c002G04758 [Penicillium vulpinum]